MPSREDIIRELESRRNQLSVDQQVELDEVLSRIEVSSLPASTPEGVLNGPTISSREMSVRGFLENIPKSASRFAGDLTEAVSHPIETVKGLGKALANPEELMFFAKSRYGSLDDALWTMYSDPVGFASDLSMFAGAIGAPLKAGGLSRVGSTVSKIGRAADPALATAKLVKTVSKRPLRLGLKFTEAGIGAATGVGSDAVRISVTKNSKNFKEAMRGLISESDIVSEVREAAHILKQRRGRAYRSDLSKMKKSKSKIDLSSLKNKVEDLLEDFRVIRVEDGSLNFSQSAIGSQGQKHITEVVKLVDNWKDTSIIGVDSLKRRIGDFYTESGQARAFISSAQKETRRLLEKTPEYKKLTKDYAVASDFLEMVEKELSLSQQEGTTVRKLTTALNQNNNFRKLLIEALDEASGMNITEKLAGSSFSPAAPIGIRRPLVGTYIIWSASTGDVSGLSALLLASPRGMGELLTSLAAVRKGVATIGKQVPEYPGAIAYRPFLMDAEYASEEEGTPEP